MATRVKIDAPNQLPPSGITAIKYKQWKVALKIFLQQTPEFREFYPGGKYATWVSLEDNPNRIEMLAQHDNPQDGVTFEEHLAQRRIHLETFLGIIARYSDEGDFDDIMEKSSSLEWIFNLHERRYGIQKKGRHFNRIDTIRFDKSTMSDYHKFYTDLRSCFKSNLRKSNDVIKYKNNQVLDKDEVISPSTECLLVYMALERIDPRLPAEIDRIFGHRMDDSTTLIDLQSEIFSYIPRALASLDREEAQLSAQQLYQQGPQSSETFEQYPDPAINAMYNKPFPQRFQNRQPFRQQRPPRSSNFNSNRISVKVCKVCQALDLPPTVVGSHNTEQCRKKAQLQQLDIQEQISHYQIEENEHSYQDSSYDIPEQNTQYKMGYQD